MTTRALDAVLATQWAILPEALETIRAIAEREHEFAGNAEALEARLGRPLGNTMTASVRDGIAVIPLEGPLFRRANLFTMFSGATSYDIAARDLSEALDNPMVQGVMLMIDSPGGEVSGTTDLAAMIRAAQKPVHAHIGGTGASAAYWLASAADKVLASDTAVIGSIGVQIGYTARDPRAGERPVRFVSSQSPLKNADPETDAGAQQVQQMVDDLAAVFVATVADHRGITADDVLQKFGKGGIMVAEKALAGGMIDGISTFEAAFASMKSEINAMDYTKLTAQSLAEHRPDLVAELHKNGASAVAVPDVEKIRAEAAAAERDRIAAIDALAMPGAEDVIAKAKAEGTSADAAAVLVLKAVKASGANKAAAHLAGIQKTENDLVAPKSTQASGEEKTDEFEAMMNLGKSHGVLR